MNALGTRYFFKAQGGMRAKPDMKPWALKRVALAGLIYVITTNQLLGCFDVVALAKIL